jgi:hypothetical protein
MLASSMIDRGFEPRSGQTKDYEIGICFPAKYAALSRKSKDVLILHNIYSEITQKKKIQSHESIYNKPLIVNDN